MYYICHGIEKNNENKHKEAGFGQYFLRNVSRCFKNKVTIGQELREFFNLKDEIKMSQFCALLVILTKTSNSFSGTNERLFN